MESELLFEIIKKGDEARNAFIEARDPDDKNLRSSRAIHAGSCPQDLLARVTKLTAERDDIFKKGKWPNIRAASGQMIYEWRDQKPDYNAFVMVLVDGDEMPFLDDLVQRGISGGEDTAQKPREAVSNYVRNLDGVSQHDPQIVVRIYANMEGLSKTYRDAKVLSDLSQLDLFVRGFNKSHPLCDFVDAGNDKEAADSKIKDVHCKHMVFGGSADNSYAGFLCSYTALGTVCTRVTLLEGPPFARSMDEIAPRFLLTTFDHIFRSSKLPTRRMSFREDRPSTPPKSPVASSYGMTVGRSGSVLNSVPGVTVAKPAAPVVPSTTHGEAPALFTGEGGW